MVWQKWAWLPKIFRRTPRALFKRTPLLKFLDPPLLPPPTETRMKAIRARKAFVSATVSVWKVLGKVELVLQISLSDECMRNVPASTVETVLCAV